MAILITMGIRAPSHEDLPRTSAIKLNAETLLHRIELPLL